MQLSNFMYWRVNWDSLRLVIFLFLNSLCFQCASCYCAYTYNWLFIANACPYYAYTLRCEVHIDLQVLPLTCCDVLSVLFGLNHSSCTRPVFSPERTAWSLWSRGWLFCLWHSILFSILLWDRSDHWCCEVAIAWCALKYISKCICEVLWVYHSDLYDNARILMIFVFI